MEAAIQKKFKDFASQLATDFGVEAKKWKSEHDEAKPKRTADEPNDGEPSKRLRTESVADTAVDDGGSAALGKAVSEEEAAKAEVLAKILSDAAKVRLVASQADVTAREVEGQLGNSRVALEKHHCSGHQS